MKTLVIDNYDSFTYNLVDLVAGITGEEVEVMKNDEIYVEGLDDYEAIILSPGPGLPSEAGQMMDLIKTVSGRIPLLGVCLGHQAIAEAFGGKLVNLETVYHGISIPVRVETKFINEDLFNGLPEKFEAGRYHSWVVSDDGFPTELEVTARDLQGVIMAFKHREFPVHGVQFHPESVLTPGGGQIMKNWLHMYRQEIEN